MGMPGGIVTQYNRDNLDDDAGAAINDEIDDLRREWTATMPTFVWVYDIRTVGTWGVHGRQKMEIKFKEDEEKYKVKSAVS